MYLFIATLSHLIVYNIKQNKWNFLHSEQGPYYGIAEYENNIIIGKRNGTDPINSYASFLVYNKNLNIIDEIKPKFPIRDLHGILILGDNLLVTSTFDNIIGIYNFISKEWICWLPNTEKNKFIKINNDLINQTLNNKLRGDKHFNTIVYNNGYINLLAHNWGKSDIYYFKLKNLEFFKKFSLGQKSHNIWYRNDEVFTLSSGTGEIVSSNNFQLKTNGFPRGFTKSKDRLYIGVCVNNVLHNTKPDRFKSSFFIQSFNYDFKDQKNFFFENIGDVCDIFYSNDILINA